MKLHRHHLLPLLCLSMLAFVPACEDDDSGSGGGSSHSSSNSVSTATSPTAINDGLVVCIGDSITQGYACDGAPYPSCLGSITGKRVLNYGAGGVRASAAPGAARRAVAAHAGAVCILYGSNDAIHGGDPTEAKEQLRAAVQICKNAGVKAILGTPPPMIGSHSLFNGGAKGVASAVKALAKEEKVPCVDLYGAFGSGEGLLVPDGLHPNAAGAMLIAQKFASKL